jgi:hypothetical protein
MVGLLVRRRTTLGVDRPRGIIGAYPVRFVELTTWFRRAGPDPHRFLSGLGLVAKPWNKMPWKKIPRSEWLFKLDRTPRVYVGAAVGIGYGYIGYNNSGN